MLKILKYIKPIRLFYSRNTVKYLSSECKCKKTCPKKVNKCAEKENKCPPRYECVQRKNEDEIDVEKIRQNFKNNHHFFRKHKVDSRAYRLFFLFVCLPIIAASLIYWTYVVEEPKRLKFYPYEHLRLRYKEYPWDPVRTLFHNPKYNALPDGYEVDVPEDEEVDESYKGCCPP